jgi:hypothetical protein
MKGESAGQRTAWIYFHRSQEQVRVRAVDKVREW